MGKGGSGQAGWRHFAGFHHILCHGPIDALYSIHVDDRRVWCGTQDDTGEITIDAPEVFGGSEREGGVTGNADVLFGKDDQTANSYLQSLQDVAIPAYRGVVSFVGKQIEHGINPYLRPWRYRVQRIFSGEAVLWDSTLIEATSVLPNSFGRTARTDISISSGTTVNVTSDPNSLFLDLIAEGIEVASIEAGLVKIDGFWEATTTGTANQTQFRYDIAFYEDDGAGNRGAQLGIDTEYRQDASGPGETVRVTVPETVVPATARHVGFRMRVIFTLPFFQSITGISREYAFTSQLIETTISNACDPEPDFPDMNPAHIIYECLVNKRWGLGQNTGDIDEDNFLAAAQIFKNEGMGLSLIYESDEQTVEEFINWVLDHIDAKLFIDRRTGKWKLKVIRNDYTVGDLLVLDDSNVIAWKDVERRDPAEGANTVVVNWYDRKRAQESSRSLPDIALIAETGRQKGSDARNFLGFTNETIVAKVLTRELVAETAPIATATLICDRSADNLNPGDPFVANSARPGIDFDEEVMRVLELRDTGEAIEIDVVSDVFDLGAAAIVSAENSGEGRATVITPAALTREYAEEATYWALVQNNGHTITDVLLKEDSDVGRLLVAASSTNGEQRAEYQVDLGTGYNLGGSVVFSPSAATVGAVSRDPSDTVIPIEAGQRLDSVVVGSLARLGSELCRVDAISDSSVTLGRGCLDTVPIDHPAGTAVIFDEVLSLTTGEYIVGDSVDVKFLPVTSQAKLAIADATAITEVFSSRAFRPLPAGNVQLAGETIPHPAELLDGFEALSWAHRDRTAQTSLTLDDFLDASIGPEVGVSYNLNVTYLDPSDIDAAGTLVTDSAIGTGTSYTLLTGDFPAPALGEYLCKVTVRSERETYDDGGALNYCKLSPERLSRQISTRSRPTPKPSQRTLTHEN